MAGRRFRHFLITVSPYSQFTLEVTVIILFNTWVQCSVWQKYTKVLMSPWQQAFWLQMVDLFYLFCETADLKALKLFFMHSTFLSFTLRSSCKLFNPFVCPHISPLQHITCVCIYTYVWKLPTSTYGLVFIPVCLSLWSLSLLVASPTSFLPSAPLFLFYSCSVLPMLHVFPANMRHGYQHSLMTLICYFLAKIFRIWQCDRW